MDGSDPSTWIALNAGLSSGSGDSDIRLLVPETSFDSSPFVYVYSHFGSQGDDWTVSSGFEEWGVRTPIANVAHISGIKFGDTNGNGVRDPGESGLASWTIFIDLDKDGILDAGEPSTVTASDGSYSFSVVDGTSANPITLWIDEVQKGGYTQTTGDHEIAILNGTASHQYTV